MSPSKKIAVVYLILLVGSSMVATAFFLDRAITPSVVAVLAGPSWAHPFGTDSLGRDLLARLLVGAKVSLTVGLVGSLLTVAIGVLAGWFGGWIDRGLMRGVDLIQSVPSFILVAVLCLGLQALLPSAMLALILGIALTHWLTVARVTRGETMKARTTSFVEAARVLGGSDAQILRKHVLPHLTPTLWVLLGIQIPNTILYESFMSFIGVGVHAPETSWGVLVEEGWRLLALAPHLVFFPALILFLTVWSLNVLFDPFRLSRDR